MLLWTDITGKNYLKQSGPIAGCSTDEEEMTVIQSSPPPFLSLYLPFSADEIINM